MISKLILTALLIFTSTFEGTIQPDVSSAELKSQRGAADELIRVSVCDIAKDPAAYNHKRIEVTGFVSRGFEDSGLFEPGCSTDVGIWVEIGGKRATGVMYCCNVPAEQSRPEELVVEGLALPLVDDANFRVFEELFEKLPDSIVHATLVGTYFSGQKEKFPGGESWVGYGHMGMSRLFVIQQVRSVDPRDRRDIDYGAAGDQPDIEHEGCGSYTILREDEKNGIKRQRNAETSGQSWVFDDPVKVATEDLARLTKIKPDAIKLVQTKKAQGRIVYYWRPNGKKGARYMVEVTKPYALLFYAKDPWKIAWLSTVYRVCD